MGKITAHLKRWELGDDAAFDELMKLAVADLRRIALQFFRGRRRHQTLQPTALVNELCLALMKTPPTGWDSHAEFFNFAARLMRNIFINHARRKMSAVHGGDILFLPLLEGGDVQDRLALPAEVILDIHRALERFEKIDPLGSQVVELHIFTGLTVHEIALALEIGESTVYRAWRTARQWLALALENSPGVLIIQKALPESLPAGREK